MKQKLPGFEYTKNPTKATSPRSMFPEAMRNEKPQILINIKKIQPIPPTGSSLFPC